MNARTILLVVEDDPLDVMTLQRAFKDANVENPIQLAKNGEEALDILRDPEAKLPGLILLDLNMPRMNGIEFLRIVKDDARLRRIPVIVLTTSNHERDKEACYDLSVAGYFVKPMDYREFVQITRRIHDYWSANEIPE